MNNNEMQFPVGKRELHRPEINYWKAAANVLIPAGASIGLCFFDARIAAACLCLYVLVQMRSIAIWFVLLYQRYAPDEMRLACVFEPSCSEYMILSIQKYGALCGIPKGIARLRRCRSPNGGIDYP